MKAPPGASQPPLSRFGNLATPAVLQKLIDLATASGIERLKQHHGGQLPAEVTLDLDATDDPVHGRYSGIPCIWTATLATVSWQTSSA